MVVFTTSCFIFALPPLLQNLLHILKMFGFISGCTKSTKSRAPSGTQSISSANFPQTITGFPLNTNSRFYYIKE